MTIGVALAGGGLKGLAHIGALKALEELGIKPDFLSGTSSGSIFATFYAMGFNTEQIKERTMEYYKTLTKIEKKPLIKAGFTYMTSGVVKIEGIIKGENIENLVKNVSKDLNITNMNQIKIPYAIATVDTISTKECIFLSKRFDLKNENIDYIYDAPIAIATRASMSFPGIYTPCQYGKYNFIDGGTKNNLPTEPLRVLGAEKIISLSFKMDEYEPKEDLMAIILRTCDIFAFDRLETSKKHSDLNIEINVPEANLLEVKEDKIEECFDAGYNAVMERKEEILKLVNQ